MKLLLATSFPIPHVGGLSTHFQMLQGCLSTRNMATTAITRNSLARVRPSNLLARAMRIWSRNGSSVVQTREAIHELQKQIELRLRQERIDVIHSHDPLSAVAVLRAVQNHNDRMAVVQTVHGPLSREAVSCGIDPAGEYYAELRRIEQESYAGCQHLIAVDSGQKAILLGDFAVPPEKVVRIPNAVDLGAIGRHLSAAPKSALASPYFLVPRRLNAKNGVDVAIRAFAILASPGCRLVIAGDGPLRKPLAALAISLGVASRVTFLGSVPREDLLPMMASSQAVIVPSVPSSGVVEATSFSALEAMACGSPVIASAIGGLREIIIDGRTGYLCPAGHHEAFAARMGIVLGLDPGAKEELVAKARASVVSEFGVQKWFDRTTAVYRAVLECSQERHAYAS
jgi:glycosyltransferase involved in cell wall biosynthesis